MIKLTKDLLHNLYVTKNLSMVKIAEKLGHSYGNINYHIKKFGIKPRTNGEHKKPKITNKTFGNWTPIREVAPSKAGHTVWLCRCKCGKERKIQATFLVQGFRTDGCNKCAGLKRRVQDRISNTHFGQILRGAIYRDLEFSIDSEYLYELLLKQKFKCALSGEELTLAKTTREHNHGKRTASLDRIDSSKGYIKGNVQWVHKDVNKLKGSFKEERLLDLCKKICQNKKLFG